ncbi:MAG: lipopolysaccharide biosynthesis protein [Sarcina sp.]
MINLKRINITKEKIKVLKDVGTLMSGAILAQILPVLISPILSRIYKDEEFGYFGTFNAVMIVIVSFANLKYDMAIINTEEENDANILLQVCNFCTLIISGILLILGCIFIGFNKTLEGINLEFIFLLFLAILFLTTSVSAIVFLNRKGDYKNIAIGQILYASIYSVISLILGVENIRNGLIIAFVLGRMAQMIYVYIIINFKYNKISFKIDYVSIKQAMIKNIKYPKYNIGAAIFNTISLNIPIVLIAYYCSMNISGQYSMTTKIINMPMILIGSAVGNIYMKKGTEHYRESLVMIRNFTISILKILTVIGSLILGFIFAYGDILFSFILGADWKVAGVFAQILSISFFANFICSPISNVFNILQRQDLNLKLNRNLMIIKIILIVITLTFFDNIYIIIFSISIAGSIGYFYILSKILKVLKINEDKNCKKLEVRNFICLAFIGSCMFFLVSRIIFRGIS